MTSDPARVAASIQPEVGLLAVRALQGTILDEGRSRWVEGNNDAAQAVLREGDDVLEELERSYGEPVRAFRKALSRKASDFDRTEAKTQAGRQLELSEQLEALGYIE